MFAVLDLVHGILHWILKVSTRLFHLNVAWFNLQQSQSVLVVVQVIWTCEQLQSLPENTAARRSLGHEAPHCLRGSCAHVNGMLSELQGEWTAY